MTAKRVNSPTGIFMSKKSRRAKVAAEIIKQQILNRFELPPDAVLPKGAVVGDPSQQDPKYRPRQYYVDRPFKCVDCGSEEVWNAEQQKWFYEVAKGSTYAEPKRCRQCRQNRQAAKGKRRPNDQSAIS
ncbi:MAG TPA: zinc-ribbon domain-containing protein [Pirellulales bacterium]